MTREEARKVAHRWVADIIDGALGNGAGDEIAADPAVKIEIQRIANRHYQTGHKPKRRRGSGGTT